MTREQLKTRVLKAIDNRASEIIEIGDSIWKAPELGYKEFKTAKLVESIYEKMGWKYKNEIGITGSKAYLKKSNSKPTVGIFGELDAVRCPEHPESDPLTGAVHACGHNAQIASMLGAGFGLTDSGVIDELDGNVVLLAVPAEEGLELDYRNSLIKKGRLAFQVGKPEFIHLGAMDDIDLCLGTHSASGLEGKLSVGGSNNGTIRKNIRFVGQEAHAGAAPHRGVNALNAALIGLMGIHAQRETFREEDTIRVHPIITKGGEIVNNVPADVRIESYVRGSNVEAMIEANKKVNRSFRAGALAIGTEVEINDTFGSHPYKHYDKIVEILKLNCERLIGKEDVVLRGHSTGSTDLGDISAVMPTSSIGMGGVEGAGHGRSYKFVDKEIGYVLPAKVLALTCIDLLFDGAEAAKSIKNSFKPTIPRKEFTKFKKKLLI
jgi:amidohydrolase